MQQPHPAAPGGRHIGGCTLRGFNHVARSAEFAIAIWLTVNEENKAARRAYEKAGFVPEGLLRQHGFVDGQYYNAVLMAVLRDDYEHTKGGA